MKQEEPIKVLFVEDSVDDAEQIISLLRNRGVAVRPARATNEAELEAAIEDHRPDVLLVNPSTRDLAPADVARQMEASGKDFAMIALLGNGDDDAVGNLYQLGFRGVAARARPDQVVYVVVREFDALRTRRRVRALESRLRESERRCDALLDSSRDPIAYVHEGMHVRANKAYLEMFGYETFDDIEGLTLLDMVASKDANHFKDLLKRLARGEKPPQRVELEAVRADGGTFEAVMEFAQATFEGEPCLQIVFRRQMVDEAMVEQLQRDAVTGVYNRARSLELIDEAVAMAAKGGNGQALLLLEPEGWRSTVDAIGMAHSDELLRAMVERLQQLLSPDDAFGRLGDHSFCVMLRGYTDEAVHQLAEKLISAAGAALFETGEHSVSLTLTVGGSLLGEKNAKSEQLMEQARTALRNAQTQGGGRYELHDPAAKEKADGEREQHWLELVRQSLESDGFILYYQQIISLQDAEGEFYEILLRMNGSNGEVLPGYFLPVAERAGLMPRIDRWVISHAITALAEREREGRQSTFFVKLTVQSMQDPELASWLAEQVQQAGLRAGSLVLELPESQVLTCLKPAQTFVSALKKIGVGFALAQFGSGLNPFQILNHVDANYLKIDRSFMAGLPKQPENQEKIASICQKAGETSRLTVAEWVEDAASTSLLFSFGVDFVQGNFLQEPEKVISLDAAIV